MNELRSHTASRVMHWVATIYICALCSAAALVVIGLMCWGVYATVRHITAFWAAGIAFIAFSIWAGGKVQDDGMAWERKEALTDEQETPRKQAMSSMSERHKVLTDGVGACSKPMWDGMGMPAGFCDDPAYGEQNPILPAVYCGGLACPRHGGPKPPQWLVRRMAAAGALKALREVVDDHGLEAVETAMEQLVDEAKERSVTEVHVE